jgi:hypothetical protein
VAAHENCVCVKDDARDALDEIYSFVYAEDKKEIKSKERTRPLCKRRKDGEGDRREKEEGE